MSSNSATVWASVGTFYLCIYGAVFLGVLGVDCVRGLSRSRKLKRLRSMRALKRTRKTTGELWSGTPQLLNSSSIYDLVHAGECPVCGVFDWRGFTARFGRCDGPLVKGRYLGCGAELVLVICEDDSKWLVTLDWFEKLFPSENPCTAAPCEQKRLVEISET